MAKAGAKPILTTNGSVYQRSVDPRSRQIDANLLGCITLRALYSERQFFEQLVQFFDETLAPAVERHQAGNVVRHEKRVLPTVAFREMKRYLVRQKWRDPVAVLLRAHEAGLAVEEVFEVLGAADVFVVI